MERFVKGDIVVLPFPYTDSSLTKRRPALIIANFKGENVITAQITTNRRNDEDLVPLTNKDFLEGALKHDSFIMLSIISTIEKSRIVYKLGKIKKEKMYEVQEKLCELFAR